MGLSDEPRGSLSLRSSHPTRSSGLTGLTDAEANRDGLLQPALVVGRTPWPMSSMIMVGEIMGTGILGLPFACSRLGWILGLAASVLFGLTAIYSGVLLARVRNDFFPEATSYADLAHLMVGPVFGSFTRGAIIVTWALLLPYYLLCITNSLLLAFPRAPLCFWQWTLVVEACLLVPLQLRSLHLISYLSAASVAAMVIAVALILGSLACDTSGAGGHSLWPAADTSFLQKYSNAGTFIFAYQGQSMFLEIMREMRLPRHFSRAVLTANGAMVLTYTLAVVVGYGARGDRVAGFLPDSLDEGPLRAIVAALLSFHVADAYIITGQPLHRTLHLAAFPATADAAGAAAAAHWLCVTVGMLCFSFVVANAIPFFDDFQNLLGTLTGTPILFGWPAFFYIRGCHLFNRRVSWADLALCALYLAICLPLFTVLGTINSVQDIVADWSKNGPPFACDEAGAATRATRRASLLPLGSFHTTI